MPMSGTSMPLARAAALAAFTRSTFAFISLAASTRCAWVMRICEFMFLMRAAFCHQRIDLDLVVRGLRDGDLWNGKEGDRERGHAGTNGHSDHLLPSHRDLPTRRHAARTKDQWNSSRDKLPHWQCGSGSHDQVSPNGYE